VDESRAWLQQALSDRSAAERFDDADSTQRCHAIAKYQQTVEKAVKAIVVALREVGVRTTSIGYTHPIECFVSVLVHLPHGAGHRDIASHLSRLLDESTRASIYSLEELIPRRPPPGQPHRKNTEYPFQDARNQWTFPAAQGVFSSSDIQRFRRLSHDIAEGASRIIATIRRAPR